jgi:hypothetical protein
MELLTTSKEEELYRLRTPASRRFFADARKCLPGGDSRSTLFYRPYPAVMDGGQGCRLFDIDGNRLLDFTGNHSSLIHGSGHPDIMAEVERQLRGGRPDNRIGIAPRHAPHRAADPKLPRYLGCAGRSPPRDFPGLVQRRGADRSQRCRQSLDRHRPRRDRSIRYRPAYRPQPSISLVCVSQRPLILLPSEWIFGFLSDERLRVRSPSLAGCQYRTAHSP